MIITIDGPSGTGKSTAAKKLAMYLNVTYFDTGALYRAISWKILKEEISYQDKEALQSLLQSFHYGIKSVKGEKRYFVEDEDVTEAIRTPEVTAIVSEVSALQEVRDALKPLQVEFAQGKTVVYEGRDLGTVVFPHAEIKFFLTARPEVRAQRRYEELKKKFPGQKFNLEKTLEEIKSRDAYDSSREVAPLKQAEDAVLIDTSHLTLDEVVDQMKEIVQARIGS